MMRSTFSSLTVLGSLLLANELAIAVRATEDAPAASPAVPTEAIQPTIDLASPTAAPPAIESSAPAAVDKAETPAQPKATVQEVAPLELDVSNVPPTNSEQSTKDATEPASPSVQVVPNPTPANVQLTLELSRLRDRMRDCLGYYFNDHESTADHSPWGIMHALIAYGVDTQIYAQGQKTNAIGFLCWNGNCRGQQLFYTRGEELQTRRGPGVQGHDGQFLAMMAQSKIKMDYPMHVNGQDFTIADLVEYEKLTCEPRTELTFKLIGLSHYLPTDTKWKSEQGEDWTIARLIREELAQPIIGAACGGTHRLMGFNYAVRKREKEGHKLDGQYLRARKFLDDYFEYTFYLQNPDGSFSTDFFEGRNAFGDENQRLETTGHILEWFVASLSEEQLRDPRVIKAATYLTDLMLDNRHHQWEIGPKGHALHALAIFSERMFGDKPGSRDAVLARGKKLHVGDQQRR